MSQKREKRVVISCDLASTLDRHKVSHRSAVMIIGECEIARAIRKLISTEEDQYLASKRET